MADYTVNFDGGETVVIAGPEFEREGFRTVGKFEHDVDPVTQVTERKELRSKDGTHVFVNKAREVLEEAGIPHRKLIFREEATNVGMDNELDMSTDALPRSEPATDPETSSQKGGVNSTVDTPADQTLANGVTDREDAQVVTEDNGKGEAPKTETIAQLKERLKTISDKEQLEKLYTEEQNGQKRDGALTAIEARAKEVAGNEG